LSNVSGAKAARPDGENDMHITALKTYMQRVDDRPRLLVKIETSEGISGWGEAYNHGPDWALPPLFDYLFHQIEGEDPRRVEFSSSSSTSNAVSRPAHSASPPFPRSIMRSGTLQAKAAGLPVYMLLGGNVRDRVRIYCGVYTAPDPEAALDQTLQLNEQYGYTAFKLSPYRRDLAQQPLGSTGQGNRRLFRRDPRDHTIAFRVRLRCACEDLRALSGRSARSRDRTI
jgi:L-alanine-DL-glutamate epimerase-like enolase superfamily enzyme